MRRSLQCASGYRPAVSLENPLTERSVDIDSDYASACAAPVRRVTGAAGDATTTDPRSRRNRASRRGGHLPTRARSQSNAAACPHLRAPGASVPDGRAVRYDLRNRSRMLAPRILYDYQFDRVPQARTSSAPRSSASFPKTMPSSARRHIALGAEGRVGKRARYMTLKPSVCPAVARGSSRPVRQLTPSVTSLPGWRSHAKLSTCEENFLFVHNKKVTNPPAHAVFGSSARAPPAHAWH